MENSMTENKGNVKNFSDVTFQDNIYKTNMLEQCFWQYLQSKFFHCRLESINHIFIITKIFRRYLTYVIGYILH